MLTAAPVSECLAGLPAAPVAVAQIGRGITQKRVLVDEMAAALAFPEYFGKNWDALSDCLTDLSWLPSGSVVVAHADLPLAKEEGRDTYLEILARADEAWSEKGDRTFVVVFPYPFAEYVRAFWPDGAPRKRGRRVLEGIARLLMAKWDPIGVGDVPEAADEYDGYAGQIYRLLVDGASREELHHYMRDVESRIMGVESLSDDEREPAVTALLAINLGIGGSDGSAG